MKRIVLAAMVALCSFAVSTASAQQTTGNIAGRTVDAQGSAVPGVTITAKTATTGFSRTEVSDAEGLYRLTGLPVGVYELTAGLSGFAPFVRKDVVVNVASTTDLNIEMKLAGVTETVSVTAESPMVRTTDSSVGGVVDVKNIESLPLNGRQFANLALTIPGVGLGFHSDPTKSTQFSPQIAGGNGRNVNYQIDGGDNNDDTVGGLLQLFPLEAIQEFNFITQRYKAEYGRSNGGVMNIVTKSGTNNFAGSGFLNTRDKSLNATTFTEKLNDVEKQDYRRYQFGGSFGGPIIQNRAHFFAAAERTQQDTKQSVTTRGLFPSLDGVYNTPSRENLFTAKATMNVTPEQFLSVRYGRNTNSQVYGAGVFSVPDNWGDSTNTFNSINVNHNFVLGNGKLNEFIFQYADFLNNVAARTGDPQETFPNSVSIGYNTNTPQTTAQHKFQFKNDFSWHASGLGGLGHDLKAGVNYIHEPKLFVTFSSGSTDYAYSHLTNDLAGPISAISRSKPGASANLPMDQYGFYLQDDWRLSNRLTVNAGLRYDLVTGFLIDQSQIPNYVALTNAAAAGRFNGVPGFDEFGKKAQEDKNNWQPRFGAVYDVRGNGMDVVRAGWGIYYDYGFTNANILFPGLSAQGGSGVVFSVTDTAGICRGGRVNGQCAPENLFHVGDPISSVAAQNEVNPAGPFYSSNVAAPQIRQPWTSQSSVGWTHQLTQSTVLDVDFVDVRGHDIGVRWPLNTRINGGARRYADLNLNPANPTMNMSIGSSEYQGINFGMRRRLDHGIQLNAWYTLAHAKGRGGQAVDELTTNLVQDATDPLGDVQLGPSARTDARHKVTLSAIIQAPWGITISPVFRYRSALPLHIWYGYDANNDGTSNDIYPTAYKFTGVSDAGVPTFEETGPCETINCGRGASLKQFNMRAGKRFTLGGARSFEVFGEVFNLFNSINPAFPIGAGSSSRLFTGTAAAPIANPNFMKPTAYAGDAGQPEQRVGQIGLRFTF
jgi:outer membrane receptor protein involved in Fe transport